MADLFGDKQGSLAVLSSDGFPAVVRLSGVTGQGSVLVTSIGFGQSANVQFMHTLKNVVYIYAFGERMGSVKVSGLLVFRTCASSSGAVTTLLNYYKSKSASRNAKPISLSIGGQTLKGFLIAVEFGGWDQTMGIMSFSLTFASLPAG